MTVDRNKLSGLLNMLGAPTDGERINAARLIARIADDQGYGIAEMIVAVYGGSGQVAGSPGRPPGASPGAEEAEECQDSPDDVLQALQGALASWISRGRPGPGLTKFEREFIPDILDRWPAALSLKQRVAIHRATEKLRRAP